MKKFVLSIIALVFSIGVSHSQDVSFSIIDGVSDEALISTIESNISHLLSGFNRAYSQSSQLDFSGVAITDDAKDALDMLWKNMSFYCDESVVAERILNTYSGYQIRNIPIGLKPETGSEIYQELVVDMDSKGVISRINLAIQNHLYRKVMSDGSDVSDLKYRQMILDYVEQFRTAYNRKDIDFLEKVFSDDALIITGKVIRRKTGDRSVIMNDCDIVYTQMGKKEYIERLRTRVFPANSFIHVNFSDIRVSKHPTVDGYYGVMLRQGYTSSTYSDDGYLFMIWDFRDEENPQIHVRTWQPYWLDEKRTKQLSEDKVFNINSFTVR